MCVDPHSASAILGIHHLEHQPPLTLTLQLEHANKTMETTCHLHADQFQLNNRLQQPDQHLAPPSEQRNAAGDVAGQRICMSGPATHLATIAVETLATNTALDVGVESENITPVTELDLTAAKSQVHAANKMIGMSKHNLQTLVSHSL